MRIVHESEGAVELRGRRQDGESGEQGLWMVWAVGVVMALAGVVAGGLRGGLGSVFVVAGALILLLGLARLARRESLSIDLDRRTLSYRTRLWPRAPRQVFEASFDDVKEIRLRRRTESPGSERGRASIAYEVLEARLLARPRRVIELERAPDETRVRALAERVARALGTNVRE